jgi:hypothetical protein
MQVDRQSQTNEQSTKPIYLSYALADEQIVRDLYQHLEIKGFTLLSRSAFAGDEEETFEDKLEVAIRSANGVIIALTPRYASDGQDWVKTFEISQALQEKKEIIPVLMDGDRSTSVPLRLSDWLSIIDLTQDHDGFKKLLEQLYRVAGVDAVDLSDHETVIFATSSTDNPIRPNENYVFISYSRQNSRILRQVVRDLRQARFEVWFDERMEAGTPNWEHDLQKAIDSCGCILLLMSEGAKKSEWVTKEIHYAQSIGKYIIPVLIKDDIQTAIPNKVATYQLIDLRSEQYRGNFPTLINELAKHVTQHDPDEQYNLVDYLEIPDIRVEYPLVGAKALSKDELLCDYVDAPVELPPMLEQQRQRYIEQITAKARENAQTLDNNLSYSAHGLSISRDQNALGFRQNIYTLHLRPTDYFHFIFPNLVLDNPIKVANETTTPREVLGIEKDQLRFDQLTQFQCHFKVGVDTIFITSDNQIVVSIRSNLQFVVGGAAYHLSAAEGMLRPVDQIEGKPSPFSTSIRSLQDELGLIAGVDYDPDDLRCIAIAMDTLRAQPVCMFYIRSRSITFKDLKQKWQLEAVDKHENSDIIGRGWNTETARLLIDGQLDYKGALIRWSSNHAQLGYRIAALHEFGMAFLSDSSPSTA